MADEPGAYWAARPAPPPGDPAGYWSAAPPVPPPPPEAYREEGYVPWGTIAGILVTTAVCAAVLFALVRFVLSVPGIR